MNSHQLRNILHARKVEDINARAAVAEKPAFATLFNAAPYITSQLCMVEFIRKDLNQRFADEAIISVIGHRPPIEYHIPLHEEGFRIAIPFLPGHQSRNAECMMLGNGEIMLIDWV